MNKIEILSKPEEVDMADDWYQFATKDHFWIKGRFRAIRSRLKNLKLGEKLFEIGCGHGVVIKQFEDQFQTTVDGCDMNMFSLEMIPETKGKIYCLNIFDKPQSLINKYDGILLLDVIEHIDDHKEFLKTSIEYLKNDGIVVINVPALNSLFSRYDTAAGHKRRYTRRMMKKLFDDCDIDLINNSYWGVSLLPIALLRKFVLLFVSREKVISTGFSLPNPLVNKLFNFLLKTEDAISRSPILGTSLIAIGKVRK